MIFFQKSTDTFWSLWCLHRPARAITPSTGDMTSSRKYHYRHPRSCPLMLNDVNECMDFLLLLLYIYIHIYIYMYVCNYLYTYSRRGCSYLLLHLHFLLLPVTLLGVLLQLIILGLTAWWRIDFVWLMCWCSTNDNQTNIFHRRPGRPARSRQTSQNKNVGRFWCFFWVQIIP